MLKIKQRKFEADNLAKQGKSTRLEKTFIIIIFSLCEHQMVLAVANCSACCIVFQTQSVYSSFQISFLDMYCFTKNMEFLGTSSVRLLGLEA
jgi:hypothetical protein